MNLYKHRIVRMYRKIHYFQNSPMSQMILMFRMILILQRSQTILMFQIVPTNQMILTILMSHSVQKYQMIPMIRMFRFPLRHL